MHWKDWYSSWSSNPLATSCEELTHWKRFWCWERLKAREEGDDRGWDGWMASLTQWIWTWASSRSWWWTEKPGGLQSMGSQRAPELNCFTQNLHSVGPNTTASYRAHSDPVLFCWLISNRFIFILISSLFCHEVLPVCLNVPSVFSSVSKLIHLYLVYT